MNRFFGLVEQALWALLFGLDRLTAGVEDFRHLRHRAQPARRPVDARPLPLPAAAIVEARTPAPPLLEAPGTPSIPEQPQQEKNVMSLDQDLSGDMVKVVQFTIVSIATNELDTARVLYGPDTIVFGDDMTAADFTSWILSEYRPWVTQNAAYIRHSLKHSGDVDLRDWRTARAIRGFLNAFAKAEIDDQTPGAKEKKQDQQTAERFLRLLPHDYDLPPSDPLLNPKWHRVAFQVVSRFAPVDIDWAQAQALYLGRLAGQLTPPVEIKIKKD